MAKFAPFKRITIDLFFHLFSAFLLSAWIYSITGNIFYVFICILGTIFIDLDHFIDYFLHFKSGFRIGEFLKCNYLHSGKVYLFFHAWEINLVVLLASIIFNSTALLILFISLSTHLLIDSLQRSNPFTYFLLYRKYKNFQCHILLPEVVRERSFFKASS